MPSTNGEVNGTIMLDTYNAYLTEGFFYSACKGTQRFDNPKSRGDSLVVVYSAASYALVAIMCFLQQRHEAGCYRRISSN